MGNKFNFKHGEANKTKLFWVWKNIKQRCLNLNNESYKENVRKRTSNKIKNIQIANEIRKLYQKNVYTQKELSKIYNVHRKTIQNIINSKT